jgi:hypothetical protein
MCHVAFVETNISEHTVCIMHMSINKHRTVSNGSSSLKAPVSHIDVIIDCSFLLDNRRMKTKQQQQQQNSCIDVVNSKSSSLDERQLSIVAFLSNEKQLFACRMFYSNDLLVLVGLRSLHLSCVSSSVRWLRPMISFVDFVVSCSSTLFSSFLFRSMIDIRHTRVLNGLLTSNDNQKV